MEKIRSLSREPIMFSLFTVVVVLAVAALVGRRIGGVGLNYQDVVTALVGITALVIALQRRGLEIGFLLWIGMFAIGYRTTDFHVPTFMDWVLTGGSMSRHYMITGETPIITIHPLSVIIIGLGCLLILQRANQRTFSWQMPTLMLPFSIFWVLGWVQGAFFGYRWFNMFPELLVFLLMPPIFLVTTNLLQKESFWKPVAVVFFAVGSLIAALGLLEFLVPGIRDAVPGFITTSDDISFLAQDGFTRAEFSFWGHGAAIFMAAFGICLVIPMWNWFPKRWQRILMVIAVALDLGGIYIAGWRSLWLLAPLVLLALLSARRNWAGVAVFLVIAYIGFTLLPTTAQERIQTAVSAVQGNYQDTSSQDRALRLQEALDLLAKNPLGMGWSGAGWVHNDFLQVSADLGIAAGALFVLWYLSTLVALWRRNLQVHDPLILGLFGCFLFIGGLMLTQQLINLPQTGLPLWFTWALATVRLRQTDNYEARGAWRAQSSLS